MAVRQRVVPLCADDPGRKRLRLDTNVHRDRRRPLLRHSSPVLAPDAYHRLSGVDLRHLVDRRFYLHAAGALPAPGLG